MALRIPKAELPRELEENMIEQLGAVPENVEILWHSPEVARDNLELGARVGAWDGADESLKSFAHMAVAAQVGCAWCLDVAYFQAHDQSLATRANVANGVESQGFSAACEIPL